MAPSSGFYPVVVGLVVGTGVVYFLLSRSVRPVRAAVVLAGAWVAAFAAAWTLAATDWNDADGFIDCNMACSATQVGIGAVFFAGPLLGAALLGLAVALRRRARRRRSARRAD